MARGKKKETLTPEDRLQAALVPESEQPYKVPGNWCWVSLQTIDQYRASSTDPSKYPDTLFELYSVPSSADNYPEIVSGCEIGSTKQSVQKGDVLLCKINPRINRVWKVSQYTGNALLASSEWIIIRNSKIVSDYLMYCFRAPYFREYMLSNVSGVGGSLMRAQPKYVKTYPVPLPPLPEQQRIVDRIESLFARLDEAKQKAQDALDSFETHKAFTGELTAQWRKEHGVGMESWERLKLGEIGTLERGRSQHRPRNDPRLFGGPYPFIQTGDVASANVYIMEHHQTLSEFGMEQSRMFSAGTLCITIAANIGDVAILSYDCCFPDSVVGFSPNSRSISKFIYYMMSILQKELEDNAPATAQKNINLKILNAVEMNIPPVTEQTEIVRILDDLLAKEQQAKEVAEGVLEQIDLIKKSVLARAFRGELGTNDPSEESVVELLKVIM